MLKKLLFITALCLALNVCHKQDKPQPNNTPAPIVVPAEDLSGKMPSDVTKPTEQEIEDALYMSEYTVYGGKKHLVLRPYVLMDVESGEVVDLRHLNAEKLPVIGSLGDLYWEKTEMDGQNTQWDLIFYGKKYIILRPYILMDIETGEEIDLRTTDRIKPGSGAEFRREN